MRACGGRSGAELGPDNFREMLGSDKDKNLLDISQRLKENKMNIYDLGNITKYQLSKYLKK